MQERHHVKTTPGEADAVPEYTPHSVRKEEGGNVQTDDINIPIVGVAVLFFAVLLSVTVVGLQAWFYNRQTAEREAKMVAADDPGTWLGGIVHAQRDELHGTGTARSAAPTSKPATTASGTTTATAPVLVRVDIDQAIKAVAADYAGAQGIKK